MGKFLDLPIKGIKGGVLSICQWDITSPPSKRYSVSVRKICIAKGVFSYSRQLAYTTGDVLVLNWSAAINTYELWTGTSSRIVTAFDVSPTDAAGIAAWAGIHLPPQQEVA